MDKVKEFVNKNVKRFLKITTVVVSILFILTLIINFIVNLSNYGERYYKIEKVPEKEVALVLGAFVTDNKLGSIL